MNVECLDPWGSQIPRLIPKWPTIVRWFSGQLSRWCCCAVWGWPHTHTGPWHAALGYVVCLWPLWFETPALAGLTHWKSQAIQPKTTHVVGCLCEWLVNPGLMRVKMAQGGRVKSQRAQHPKGGEPYLMQIIATRTVQATVGSALPQWQCATAPRCANQCTRANKGPESPVKKRASLSQSDR